MMFALAAIVFVAFTIEATAGFGSLMISLAIGTLIWPIATLLPIVVPISLCLTCYMLSRYWRQADWSLLLRAILPLMILGTLSGMYLLPQASPALLRTLLGVVVTGAALRGLWTLRVPRVKIATGLTPVSLLWIAAAGVIHGMIATGGPALVYALEGVGLDKRAFRSTLAVVWCMLNGILTIRFVVAGTLAFEQASKLLMLLPVVALAIVCGEQLHTRVSERVFRTSVFCLLVIAGFLLWGPVLWSLV